MTGRGGCFGSRRARFVRPGTSGGSGEAGVVVEKCVEGMIHRGEDANDVSWLVWRGRHGSWARLGVGGGRGKSDQGPFYSHLALIVLVVVVWSVVHGVATLGQQVLYMSFSKAHVMPCWRRAPGPCHSLNKPATHCHHSDRLNREVLRG